MNNNQTPPDKPGGEAPGQGGASSVSYNGNTTFSESTTLDYTDNDSVIFSSSQAGENALLVTGGEVVIKGAFTNKGSGDETSEDSDFYGTNAAILTTGGLLTYTDGSIITSAAHANAVFAYGEGGIVVKNTTIKTSGDNSGGIMVTGGGSLIAEDVTVETSGRSSAPIRSDRGGGAMSVTGGSYTSNGVGSPAIYSTANISVIDAKLTSNASEGVVIEGKNSASLTNVTLVDTNNTLNGNSETYKNIFIYQSMSGDAEEGVGYFYSDGSSITTNQGDTFFVTNTNAEIELTNNRFVNNDATSAFLRVQAGKWGTSGQNGGHVKLTMTSQVAEGDIILDNISTLNLILGESSYYMGVINGANTAQSVSVSLDKTSQLILAGDSHISALDNADETNMNIYSNGYKLYVAGEEVEINGSEIPEAPETEKKETETKTETTETKTEEPAQTNLTPFIVGGVAILVIIAAIIAFVIHNKKKNGPATPTGSVAGFPTEPTTGRPDFSQFDDSNNVGKTWEGFPKQ